MDLEELDDAQQSAVSCLSDDWFKRHEAYWRVWGEQEMGGLVQPTHGETTSSWHLLRVNDTRS